MESFSLLKYWRTGGGASGGAATDVFTPDSAKVNTKTIVTAAATPYCSDGEDGPFFDLEFALPEDEEESEKSDGKAPETEDEDETESESDGEEEEEGEINFALDSSESTDQNVALSPSDELFFKGDLVSIEPSSILLNASEENSKLPVFLVKSATKFRVLLLKLKKSKSINGENVEKSDEKEKSGKSISVKFKVEEVPLVNLFTRDSSSKENINGRGIKQNAQDSEDRKVMHKYLKMVKPFYIRVSKRYKFPGGGASKGCAPSPPEKQGTNNLQAGLRVVRKHLGKSRSASSAVSAASPVKTTSERRDDSLLQVQDGIQGAILHCKRSFNASREMESSSSSSILCRSVSDPSYEKKSVMMGEAKGCKN
ncbi:hypothetical protein ACS0TY_004207 [Phlomoides rotata]